MNNCKTYLKIRINFEFFFNEKQYHCLIQRDYEKTI